MANNNAPFTPDGETNPPVAPRNERFNALLGIISTEPLSESNNIHNLSLVSVDALSGRLIFDCRIDKAEATL
ncbi:hypothetical protein ANAPC1_01368 [Anaplasma phagocytophilum]|uniref:Uncharacterized protein n=1 Tax=Anaplasma phagocytophilum TaxID=948 RepID=A0AA45UUI2_ANAPH|nr:hypothetical protein ANAPC1_01368 [Anaplasma phagocytophilum]